MSEWQKAEHTPLTQDLGRAFLYARYNTDLSGEGLDALGCGDMDPEKVQKLDGVDQIDNLLRIGAQSAQEVDLQHFGSFAQQAKGAS